MPRNPTYRPIRNTPIVAKAVLASVLILPIMLIFPSCTRTADTAAPAVTAADRALPVPVDIPDEPAARPRKAAQALQRKIPVEDTAEPIPIDDVNVPASANGVTGSRTAR